MRRSTISRVSAAGTDEPSEGAAARHRVDDARLVARLQAGDDRALREAYDEYAPFVFGLAQRVTASRSLAEEVTQEVFVQVWTRAERIDVSRGSLRSYLGVLAHRRAVDIVRSEASRRAREDRDAAQAGAVEPDLAEHTAAAAQADLVRVALAALPDEQRQIVILTYLDGHSYRDAARLLSIPEGTAKSRGRLALRKLAAALASAGLDR